MNDETREKLSAYLDGALSDQERRAVELEISRSEEVRREFEALRAVSSAVKGLPKEKLPSGFQARLQARLTREGSAPRPSDYFILPPAFRPVAFAMSSAVVALLVWDKAHPPAELPVPQALWDTSKTTAVKTAAEAPPSVDVSGRLSALAAAGGAGNVSGASSVFDGSSDSNELARKANKQEAVASAKPDAGSTYGKHLKAPGKPYGMLEMQAPAAPAVSPAPTAVTAADSLEPMSKESSFNARSEEERSAINEKLYKGFEDEKKRMGIAKIVDKDSDDERNMPTGGRELRAMQAPAEADVLAQSSVAGVRGAAKAKARARKAAPAAKAVVLKSADALQAAWAAAGLAGEPPEIDFKTNMAVFLAGSAGCGITDIQERKRFLVVLYKPSGFIDPAARVRALPAVSKPVVVKLAD